MKRTRTVVKLCYVPRGTLLETVAEKSETEPMFHVEHHEQIADENETEMRKNRKTGRSYRKRLSAGKADFKRHPAVFGVFRKNGNGKSPTAKQFQTDLKNG